MLQNRQYYDNIGQYFNSNVNEGPFISLRKDFTCRHPDVFYAHNNAVFFV